MTSKVTIRDTEAHDAEYLAPLLREIDKKEIYCVSKRNPREALNSAFIDCEICHTAVFMGAPIAMFGITKADWGGIPWLLGSESMDKVKLSAAKLSKSWVELMLKKYGLLKNIVHAENDKSIIWLRDHLMFDIGEDPIILRGNPFLVFERRE